jgi:murein DD-endopeptidase MepM/ murein hydrolase activator NlpD
VLLRLLLVLTVLPALLAPAAATAEPARPPSSPGPALLWVVPLPGDLVLTRPFEAPPHPYGRGHRGVDLRGFPGLPVLAAGDGVVAFAGMVAGRPLLSVDHAGGLRTTYEPVDPSVGAGQHVARGSPIGTLAIGHAGCPVEACLHWGLRRSETYLDPLMLVRPPRVRLLPRAPAPASA